MKIEIQNDNTSTVLMNVIITVPGRSLNAGKSIGLFTWLSKKLLRQRVSEAATHPLRHSPISMSMSHWLCHTHAGQYMFGKEQTHSQGATQLGPTLGVGWTRALGHGLVAGVQK